MRCCAAALAAPSPSLSLPSAKATANLGFVAERLLTPPSENWKPLPPMARLASGTHVNRWQCCGNVANWWRDGQDLQQSDSRCSASGRWYSTSKPLAIRIWQQKAVWRALEHRPAIRGARQVLNLAKKAGWHPAQRSEVDCTTTCRVEESLRNVDTAASRNCLHTISPVWLLHHHQSCRILFWRHTNRY